MSRIVDITSKYIFGCSLALSLFVPLAGAHAQTTVYTFTGGNDGGNPPCGLISGGKGVPGVRLFYGTTQIGGANNSGTVFQVTSNGTETVRYSFTGGSDGAYPLAGLLVDRIGNLFGTTAEGGAHGLGVVFRVNPDGTETVLHAFSGGSDGAQPAAGLVEDGAGNLWGTTVYGGTENEGTVFEIPSGGGESVVHSFTGNDGAFPEAGLVIDASGNFYGTTEDGGTSANCGFGCGTVFRLTGSTETVLHSFTGTQTGDGSVPAATVIVSGSGNVYGTTQDGGTYDAGTVFEISHKGKETVLHSFGSGSDGAFPVSPLVKKSGYFYGTTYSSATSGNGTVYKIPDKGGADTVLYNFTGGSDGGNPEGGLLYQSGYFFGTAYAGGDAGCAGDAGCGVVFAIKP
jgi:uncharacterized repeat protein (TIGR03803 family)